MRICEIGLAGAWGSVETWLVRGFHYPTTRDLSPVSAHSLSPSQSNNNKIQRYGFITHNMIGTLSSILCNVWRYIWHTYFVFYYRTDNTKSKSALCNKMVKLPSNNICIWTMNIITHRTNSSTERILYFHTKLEREKSLLFRHWQRDP